MKPFIIRTTKRGRYVLDNGHTVIDHEEYGCYGAYENGERIWIDTDEVSIQVDAFPEKKDRKFTNAMRLAELARIRAELRSISEDYAKEKAYAAEYCFEQYGYGHGSNYELMVADASKYYDQFQIELLLCRYYAMGGKTLRFELP